MTNSQAQIPEARKRFPTCARDGGPSQAEIPAARIVNRRSLRVGGQSGRSRMDEVEAA